MKVNLTLQQAEQVQWALGAMIDYWTDEGEAEARGGEVYPETALPRIEDSIGKRGVRKTSKTLVLSDEDEINDDLLYRLEEQLPDMARQAGTHWNETGGSVSAAINAAKRIRHILKYHSGD